MSKKVPYIRYTSRKFDDIRNDLINYAKKYYPNTHQDFNEGSFGSLMIDTVSYVGDIMSFYLDYQTNESFLDTAIEYDNILKLGAGLGYRPKTAVSAVGNVTMYISIPGNAYGTDINSDYLPVIKKGTTFQASDGNTFTLLEDVVLTKENTEIRKSRINNNGPFEYVAKFYGKVISGSDRSITVNIGDFEKFRKILIGDSNVTEVVSVTDSDGNLYYEVDYLTQNVIYKAIANTSEDKEQTPNILKPYSVVRRFIVIREKESTYIQFGGAAASENTYLNNKKIDPSSLVLERIGKNYTTDESFDPTLLVTGDKLGIAPVNTTLTINFRQNTTNMNSVPARAINVVNSALLAFEQPEKLVTSIMSTMTKSLIVVNEMPINGQTDDYTSDELKSKVYGTFAAQNRAVTEEDYKALSYNMPGKYGSIKRVRVLRDNSGLKRNLNLYVISENSYGNLVETNPSTKNNLKNWLNRNKVINDTIDILDAKVVNFGIYFTAVAEKNFNKYDLLASALNALKEEFSLKMDIGEPIQIARVYDCLRRVQGILDVREVNIQQKFFADNTGYSTYTFNFDKNLTSDGLFLNVPKNVIMEIKYPDTDLEGKIL